VAPAYEKTGKLADAVKFVKSRIDGATSAGKKPPENELLLLLDYQRRLKDEKGAAETFEKLVSYYQKADYWENILQPVLKAPGNTDAVTLNIYRLMRSTGALKRATDYTEMAQLASENGSAGEALEVLQKGISSNAFTEARDKDRNARLLESIKKKVAADQAGVAKADADAKAGKSGDADVAVARTYFGLAQYDKATEALKRGIAKGGLSSAEEAQTLLGISLLRQKKGGEAVAAFKAVKGDPKFTNVASYWAIHAR
jgi:type I site-specific restriction endonuclease